MLAAGIVQDTFAGEAGEGEGGEEETTGGYPLSGSRLKDREYNLQENVDSTEKTVTANCPHLKEKACFQKECCLNFLLPASHFLCKYAHIIFSIRALEFR